MSTSPAPFRYTHSPGFGDLLASGGLSLAVTTHQAGKVVVVSAGANGALVQLPRSFEQAMPLAVDRDRMAIGTRSSVVVLQNVPSLAERYPRSPHTYDALYVPRVTHHTGRIDLHGLCWGAEGLWAVVTAFSCLGLIDDTHSFVPHWRPPFAGGPEQGDSCHLNGMTLEGGRPAYVTALGRGAERHSWRKTLADGGVLLHVPTGEIVLGGLPMPHSPRLVDGELYVLLSATGEVARVDAPRGTYDVIHKLRGFVRGLAIVGERMFIGRSRLRSGSTLFGDLAERHGDCPSGVTVVNRKTGAIEASFDYETSVDEIFDVEALPGKVRPGILGTHDETHKLCVVTPRASYWGVETE